MRTAYLNGDYLPIEDAKVSILDRGFTFADGIYEVAAVIGGKLIDNDAHLARLERSLGEIQMPMPIPKPNLVSVMEKLVQLNDLNEGIVYLQVTRGVAERDFPFPKEARQTLAMFTQAESLVSPPAATIGLKAITCPDIRWGRRDIKSVGLLAQVLAKQIAAEAGVGEALLVEDGEITEGASSSAFIITDQGELITRKADHSILPGITRMAVFKLVEKTDLALTERRFTIAEAKAAREVFITSASNLVMAIVEIDGHQVANGQPGPYTKKLRAIYLAQAGVSA